MRSRMARLDRRQVLAGFGLLGVGRVLPGCGSDDDATGDGESGEASCALTPAQTEGPFFFDTGFMRSDIRDGKPGVDLALSLRVVDGETCAPLPGALVEVWHADADGAYSAFDVSQGNSADAAGQTFLRGFQTTDSAGLVQFRTVYPGWYPGRTPHVHLMVLLADRSALLTTQLYFPESVTDAVYALAPYAGRGPRSTTNAQDGVGVPGALLGQFTEDAGAYATTFRLVVPPRS